MAIPQSGCGCSYRIYSPTATWNENFGYGRKQAMLRDLEEIGGMAYTEHQVEFWEQSDMRAAAVPVMVVALSDSEIIVSYFGGDDGVLLQKLCGLVEIWKRRYFEPDLAIVAM